MSDLYTSAPQNLDLISVIVAGLVNLSIAGVLIVAFSILRPHRKRIYEPKTLFSLPEKRLKRVPGGITSWLNVSLKTNEILLMDKIGLDSIVLIQFLALCVKLFSLMSVFSIMLILVQYYAPSIDKVVERQDVDFKVSLGTISIQNIKRGSNLFYIHSVCCYIYSIYCYYLLLDFWKRFKLLKIEYFKKQSANLNSKILSFTSLTQYYKKNSELEQLIYDKTGQLPKNLVYDRDCSALLLLMKSHSNSIKKLEKLLTIYFEQGQKERPMRKINKKLGVCNGNQVDAIDYYKTKLDNLEVKIYTERALGDEHLEQTSCCFVEFNDIKQAHSIYKSFNNALSTNKIVQATNILQPRVKLCPEFNDLMWSNIGLSPPEIRARKFGATAATFAITFFWFFVIALAQLLGTIISSPRFANVDPVISAILVFLQSIASPAIMAFLNILIIIILRQISIQQGVVTKTGIERSTLLKFFVFQVYQILTRIGVEVIKAYLENFVTGKATNDQFNNLLKSVISNVVAVIEN